MTTIDSSNNQTTDSLECEILHDATQIFNSHSEPATSNDTMGADHLVTGVRLGLLHLARV